ncbi:unnamed protein product [Meganyctiphanes norvegica]|uniref:Uncharacterized protein n=1 Tax=Meganyctiphanes norvegica TaxID=48144 RepID=A0AAV2RRD9_MEGNR
MIMIRWFIIPLMGVGVWTIPQNLDGSYQFSYAVASPENLDYHGHQESRTAFGITSGSYYHLGPDGLWHHTIYYDDGTGIRKIYKKLPPESPPPEFTGFSHQLLPHSVPQSSKSSGLGNLANSGIGSIMRSLQQKSHSLFTNNKSNQGTRSSSHPRNILQAATKTSSQGFPILTSSHRDATNHQSFSFKKSPVAFSQRLTPQPLVNFRGNPNPLTLSSNLNTVFSSTTQSPVTTSFTSVSPLARSLTNSPSFPNTLRNAVASDPRFPIQSVNPVSGSRAQTLVHNGNIQRNPFIISQDNILNFQQIQNPQLTETISPISLFTTGLGTVAIPLSNLNTATSRRLFSSQDVNANRQFQGGQQLFSRGNSLFIAAPLNQRQIRLLLNEAVSGPLPPHLRTPLLSSLQSGSNEGLPTVHADRIGKSA